MPPRLDQLAYTGNIQMVVDHKANSTAELREGLVRL